MLDELNGVNNSKSAILVSPTPGESVEEDDGLNGVMSPFSRIQNDLEMLVNELETDSEASTNGRGRPEMASTLTNSTTKPRVNATLPRRPSSTTEPTMNESIASRSLWIGNLDPTITETELRTEFEPFGAIESLRLLPTKECAFVNYYKLDHAMMAKEKLHGTAIGNMIIRIGFGKTEGNHGNGPLNPSNNQESVKNGYILPGFIDSHINVKSVWVGQIEPDCDTETLLEAFKRFGEIESCRILDSKNCAFINFVKAQDAETARNSMNGARLGTAIIKTGFARSNMTSVIRDEQFPQRKPGISASSNSITDNNEDKVPISTQEVSPDEYKHLIPMLPLGLRLPNDLNSSVIRECRRRVEHVASSTNEVDAFAAQIFDQILAASVDPVGNILVQKLIEKGSSSTRTKILEILGPFMATVGVHKNGTWVVQKLVHHCLTYEQRDFMAQKLKPFIVPLMQDQFGNYVVQCCLVYGPAQNQFIFDALYHRCVDIATSRFGSRAMRSCLDSHTTSVRQKKFVAMAIINHALTLVHDNNGVIVVQWLLDSDLPGRQAFIAPVLKGRLANLCLSKHASSVVAKLIQPSSDISARDLVIHELFSSSYLSNLLQEPMAAAIILRALGTAKPEQRLKMAHQLEPHLSKLAYRGLPHLQRLNDETKAALEIVQLEPEKRTDLPKLFQSTGCALPTHTVGGPVSNRSIIRQSINNGSGINQLFEKDNTGPPNPQIGRRLSFGSVSTIISATPEDYNKTSSTNDRLSFGPSLLQRLDSQIDRPPTPS